MGYVFLDILNQKMPALVAGGFDFVDVRDVVKGALLAQEKGRIGENYLISGRHFTIRELMGIVSEISGVKVPKFDTPIWLANLIAPFAEKYALFTKTEPLFTRESLLTLRANKNIVHYKATRELGYIPRDIRETVRDILVCFQERGLLPKGIILIS